MARRRRRPATSGSLHVAGIRATADGGTCAAGCDEPILKDERIVPRGDNKWAHVRCVARE